MKLIQFFFLLFFISGIANSIAQDRPEKKKYTIDFSGINTDNPPPEKPKENTENPVSFKGVELPNTNFFSNKVVSGFNNNHLNYENFGELTAESKFGKADDKKAYYYAGIPTQYINDPSNKDFIFGDVSFGDHETNDAYIVFSFKDSSLIDGDVMKIVLNGKTVFSNVRFTGKLIDYRIALEKGVNKIEVVGLNNGYSGPITCNMICTDASGNNLVHKTFNVVEGYVVKGTVTRN